MKVFNKFKNRIQEMEKDEYGFSGTSEIIVIIALVTTVAYRVFSNIGNAVLDKGDQTTNCIKNSNVLTSGGRFTPNACDGTAGTP